MSWEDDIVIKFEIIKERKDWATIEGKWDGLLSKMDEGTISYEELIELKESTEKLLKLGNKVRVLLQSHLVDPVNMNAEKILKQLLNDYHTNEQTDE
jgi:hypothetical protein